MVRQPHGVRNADKQRRPGLALNHGGDATQIDSVEKVLAGGLADMVFTDPRYNVNYGATMKDKLRGRKRKIANDNLGDGFEQFLRDACTNILTVTKGAVYICMSSSELHTLQKAFREAGGHWSTFVIWAKNTFTMGRSDYQRQYKPILYGWKEGSDHFWCGARDQGDVWFVKKTVSTDLHPTMKPVELVERRSGTARAGTLFSIRLAVRDRRSSNERDGHRVSEFPANEGEAGRASLSMAASHWPISF